MSSSASSPTISRKLIALIATCLLFSLLFPFPVLIDELVDEPITNLLHFPIGFLGVYFLSIFFLKLSIPLATPFIGALVLILACLIELLQELTGRSASFTDIHITFWGIITGIAYTELKIHKPTLRKRYLSLLLSGLTIGALITIPPIFIGYNLYKERETLYPVLLSPDSKLSNLVRPVEYTYLNRNPTLDCSVEVHTETGYWGGLELTAGNKDWSTFNELSISLTNNSEHELQILIRIDDSGDTTEVDSRYGEIFTLKANEKNKNILIPTTHIKNSVPRKNFNLEQIHRILLATDETQKNSTFCISRIELK